MNPTHDGAATASRPLRILTLEYWPSTVHGGQPRSHLDVCRGLASRGHHLVLAFQREGELLEQYARFARTVRIERSGLDYRRLGTSGRELLRVFGRLRGIAREERIDLVYAGRHVDTLLAATLARALGVRAVGHLREPAPERFLPQTRLGTRLMDGFVTPSEATRRSWIAYGIPAARIEVVPNGIDPARFPLVEPSAAPLVSLGVPADSVRVLYCGRITRDKGLEDLVQACALLKRRHPTLHLVLAGALHQEPTEYLDELRSLAAPAGDGAWLHFVGHVEDPAPLYAAAHVSVLPSRFPEPFGRALIESMSCGTLAVGTQVGGIPDILRGELAELTCPSADPPALAAAVERALERARSDPGSRASCRAFVEANYSIEATVTGVERILLKQRDG